MRAITISSHIHRAFSLMLSRMTFVLTLAALSLSPLLALKAFAIDREEGLSGEINVGGSISSGNADIYRVDTEVKARFKAGRLEDNYRLQLEFADNNGTTTAQRILGTAESRLDIRDGLFVYGFLEYDDDRFSGFKYEIESSVGAGYKVIETPNMRLLAQTGIGYRLGSITDPTPNENELILRASADFEWDLSNTFRITNVSTITTDKERNIMENTVEVSSKIFASLSSRLSFNVRYNSDPPLRLTRKTDTLTKFSLVYDF